MCAGVGADGVWCGHGLACTGVYSCVRSCTVMYSLVRGVVRGCTLMYAGRCGEDDMIEDYRFEGFGNIEGFFLFRGVRHNGL